jgi:AAA ATPase domain
MDARLNPYTPGAGVAPTRLAGHGNILRNLELTLDRSRDGRVDRNLLLTGLRGSGKTALLNWAKREAESRGLQALALAANQRRSLPALLLPDLRALLIRLSQRNNLPVAQLQNAAAVMAGFALTYRRNHDDVELSGGVAALHGVADSGELELDLGALLTAFAELLQASGSALWLLIDDLHQLRNADQLTLLAALARVGQRELPLVLLATALPKIADGLSRAGSLAERLLSRYELVALAETDAAELLIAPAALGGVKFEVSALTALVRAGVGSPYILQQLGHAAWAAAESSPIRLQTAQSAIPTALAELDAGFFRQQFHRLTPHEQRYLRAMAELGPGVHRSGSIAARLERKVTALAPTRSGLIAKGLIYSPEYGETTFTTPLYEGFVLRTLPGLI